MTHVLFDDLLKLTESLGPVGLLPLDQDSTRRLRVTLGSEGPHLGGVKVLHPGLLNLYFVQPFKYIIWSLMQISL